MMRRYLLMTFALAAAGGCGDDGALDPELPFGETAVVVVVNPLANDGNTAAPPSVVGTTVEGVTVDAEPGGEVVTDGTGLAGFSDLEPVPTTISLDDAPPLTLNILENGDLYDLAVAYDGDAAAFYPGFPIRYGVGGDIVVIPTETDATEALNTDNTIVFFEDGIHVGDLVIEGEDVILFGESPEGSSVVVDGNVEVRGGQVRIRGVTVTGDLTVFGDSFGMSFSVVQGATSLNGQSISFLRNVFCQGAVVPSSDAALYDNEGLAPLPAPPAPTCPDA